MLNNRFLRPALYVAAALLATAAPAAAQTPGQPQQEEKRTVAAEPWSMARCIEYARANNLQVQSAQVSAEASDIELEAAKASRYPTLSFNTGQDVSHQSAIKLINDYGEVVSNGSFSYGGSYGIGSTTTIYQGGRLRNNIRQQERRAESSRLGVEKSLNDITVSVVQAYLQTMYAAETVEINRRAVELARQQADRAQRMFDEGAVARTEVAQMLSQLGSAKYDLTTAQNNLAQYRLQLKQLLELGPEAQFEVEFPEISDDEVLRMIPSVEEVYGVAVETMPETRQAEILVEASEYAERAARAAFYPQVSLSANVSTGHQSGTSASMGSQLGQKLNESIGLSLSVPIFNGKSAHTSVRQARLTTRQAEIDSRNACKDLLSTIESLHRDAVAAQANYMASEQKLAYAEESYRLAAAAFEQGKNNAVELNTEKNNYLAALSARLQAKYQSVLSVKILAFYRGEPITL